MPKSLDEVLITAELARRPTRSPDYETENRALSAMAEAMVGSPQMILQKLVEAALSLCRADSAGISVLEPDGVAGVFRWHATAGQFAPNTGKLMLREASPSGIVLDRDTTLLFSYPERHFHFGMAIDPPIVEALLVPFHTEGKPVGTVWVIAHTPSRKFDTEDQRVLTSLSRFASMAYQLKTTALSEVRAELKQTTEALRKSEESLRLAVSSGPIGIWDWDVSTDVPTCSPEFCELYGFEVGAAPTYQDFRSRVHPEDLAALESERDAAIRGHKPFDLEFRIVRPSGEVRWLSAKGKGYYDENGRLVRVVGNNIDVTARKQAEEALREREQRLRLALDASGAGSWVRDTRTGRVDWDDRLREMYGFTAGEQISFEAWLSRVHEEDRPQVLELWDRILQTNMDSFDCTFRVVRPDGTVSWIESLGQVHRDVHGQILQLNGLELDVTERRRAEEALQTRRDEERDRARQKQAEMALRQSHSELQQRALQLRRLASDLTLAEHHAREELAKTLHDGLQQLLFSAAMALDRAVSSNSHADWAALLQRARSDMNEAMEAARTLSMNLFPPMLNIGGLPVALEWLAKRMQKQYGVVVNLTAAPEANPRTRDARILLFEAVRELLFNAVKHAHVDQVDVKLEVGRDDAIHIQVSDEGIGFDPVVTLHHRQDEQVGLGLFSIEERLALFGGRLDIQSSPGKGARFRLTLEQSNLAAGAPEERRDDGGWRELLGFDSTAVTSKPLRILISDDHVVARAGLRELFSERPGLWVVGEAANGVEAISQAMVLRPDVIVMDASMPLMNGIVATREIRTALPHVQIVGLSTHDDEFIERSMREAGAEAYFSKNDGADRLLDYLLAVRTQAKGTTKS
jgi:PAS domain S-box-containing protein